MEKCEIIGILVSLGEEMRNEGNEEMRGLVVFGFVEGEVAHRTCSWCARVVGQVDEHSLVKIFGGRSGGLTWPWRERVVGQVLAKLERGAGRGGRG